MLDGSLGGAGSVDGLLSGIYEDVLGRPVDDEGADYFGRRLRDGTLTAGQVALVLVHSDEYRGQLVDELYRSTLGRPADGEGREFWAGVIGAGIPVQALQAGLLGSEEYLASVGGEGGQFLNSLYADVLHRPVDESGGQFWESLMQLGVTRDQVALALLQSPEALKLEVQQQFDRLLARAPDVQGANVLVTALQAGMPIQNLLPIICGSEEYVTRQESAGTSDPARFSSSEELLTYLQDRAGDRWGGVFGTFWTGLPVLDASSQSGIPTAIGGTGGSVPSPTSGSFSGTNVQVEGVDEADIVETDGKSAFVLSANELVIIDAVPADQMTVLSRTELNGHGIAMFLSGSRLTVVSQEYFAVQPLSLIAQDALYPYQPSITVTIFDVSDPSAPTMVQETKVDGNYVSSRAIGSSVYLVVQNDLFSRMGPAIQNGQYESETQYAERIGKDTSTLLPQYHAMCPSDPGSEITGPVSEAVDIYKPVRDGDDSLVSVLVFDMASDSAGAVDSVSIMAPFASTVAASAEHLFLVTQRWDGAGVSSGIFQFDLGPGSVSLSASGSVPGHIVNQFAVDEYDGYIRITTTTSDNLALEPTNNLYVLDDVDGNLDIVGRIVGLAPGERLFATRFTGDVGYMVTFRQVDPLFTLDLSDPTNPQVVGELKVPGFSTYLHPIDETHLLGIGRNANPVTGRTEGLQVSLFDISDLNNPQQIDTYLIHPEDWTWSDAEYDHHAITYLPEQGILALPVQGSYSVAPDGLDAFSFVSDLLVFDVNLETGFELIGQVTQDQPILRSFQIGDVLYSLTSAELRGSLLSSPGTTVGEVTYGTSTPLPGPTYFL